MVSAINDDARPEVAEIKRRIERLCSDPGHAFCDNWGHEDVLLLVAEIENYSAVIGTLQAEIEQLKQDRDDADRDVETLQAVLKRQDAEVERLRAEVQQLRAGQSNGA